MSLQDAQLLLAAHHSGIFLVFPPSLLVKVPLLMSAVPAVPMPHEGCSNASQGLF